MKEGLIHETCKDKSGHVPLIPSDIYELYNSSSSHQTIGFRVAGAPTDPPSSYSVPLSQGILQGERLNDRSNPLMQFTACSTGLPAASRFIIGFSPHALASELFQWGILSSFLSALGEPGAQISSVELLQIVLPAR